MDNTILNEFSEKGFQNSLMEILRKCRVDEVQFQEKYNYISQEPAYRNDECGLSLFINGDNNTRKRNKVTFEVKLK